MKRPTEMKEKVAVVTCKCIGCGTKRDVKANEIPPDEVPMCPDCMMPMIAESARAA
jgi:NAD-dependent SIR2 family protein deacetylase